MNTETEINITDRLNELEKLANRQHQFIDDQQVLIDQLYEQVKVFDTWKNLATEEMNELRENHDDYVAKFDAIGELLEELYNDVEIAD